MEKPYLRKANITRNIINKNRLHVGVPYLIRTKDPDELNDLNIVTDEWTWFLINDINSIAKESEDILIITNNLGCSKQILASQLLSGKYQIMDGSKTILKPEQMVGMNEYYVFEKEYFEKKREVIYVVWVKKKDDWKYYVGGIDPAFVENKKLIVSSLSINTNLTAIVPRYTVIEREISFGDYDDIIIKDLDELISTNKEGRK